MFVFIIFFIILAQSYNVQHEVKGFSLFILDLNDLGN